MAKYTNYSRGSRGIGLKDGTTVWLEPGESADLKKEDIADPLPDLGQKAEAVETGSEELDALKQQVADLTKQVEALTGDRDGLKTANADLTKQVEALTKPADKK